MKNQCIQAIFACLLVRYASAQSLNQCMQPLDGGFPCGMPLQQQFYYNMATKSCQSMVYTGCGGNTNRFTSLALCQTQCGASGTFAGDGLNNSCGPNEEVVTSAEPTCTNQRPVCACVKGTVRNVKTGQCIQPSSCPEVFDMYLRPPTVGQCAYDWQCPSNQWCGTSVMCVTAPCWQSCVSLCTKPYRCPGVNPAYVRPPSYGLCMYDWQCKSNQRCGSSIMCVTEPCWQQCVPLTNGQQQQISG